MNFKVKNKIQGAFRWTKDYLIEYLTAGKNAVVHDPAIITALNKVDRKEFVPNELKDRSYEDSDLEIVYGEKLTRPSIIAQMLQLLEPKLGGKYLDIGTGTGYFAMLLAFAIGEDGQVITVERVQWLWDMARENFSKFKDVNNIRFLYRDGTSGVNEFAPYDGIHVSFIADDLKDDLKMQLKQDGAKLVYPTADYEIRVIERTGPDEFVEEIIPGFVFQERKAGTA